LAGVRPGAARSSDSLLLRCGSTGGAGIYSGTSWADTVKKNRMATTTARNALSDGDRHLRASVLFAVAVHSLFIMFFTVFLFQHANPTGDGMEMVGSSIAFMFIFLPFSLPAYLLANSGRLLILATLFALIASFLYFGLWLEFLDELNIQTAPWNTG
jgi:hypothetical protein